LVAVPECAAHLAEPYYRRKSGLRSLEKIEDALRSTERVTLESEELASVTRSSPARDRTRSGCAASAAVATRLRDES
jgi:hypothetical protein